MAVRYVVLPLTHILIILEWVEVGALAVGFVVAYFALVDAAVVEYVSAFAFGFAVSEGSLVV